MKSIYRSENAKKAVLELYDRQIAELNILYQNLYVDTSFGKTHLIECGNPEGKPSTEAYCSFLRQSRMHPYIKA